MRKLLFALALSLAAVAADAATEVQGVRFEDRMKSGDAELVLNGAGLRARFFIKVYAIGLYVTERKSTGADLAALKGAKRLHLVTLRELTAEQFADALVEGIRKNHSDAEIESLNARVEQFKAAILALKTAPKGATVQIDWLPESGTRFVFNGEKRGEDIPGEDFYRAVLKIWLGENPAQGDLKEALLGKAAP